VAAFAATSSTEGTLDANPDHPHHHRRIRSEWSHGRRRRPARLDRVGRCRSSARSTNGANYYVEVGHERVAVVFDGTLLPRITIWGKGPMNDGRVGVQISLAGGALALCLLAVCLFYSPRASAASTCPGRNGQVAAIVTDTEQYLNAPSIGIVEPNMQVQPLYRPPSFPESAPVDPSFSCDGSEILFQQAEETSCGHLEIVTLEGRRSKLHIPHLCPYSPAFLSDGKVIFAGYSAATHAGPEVSTYEANSDGSHPRRLFTGAERACTVNGRWFVSGLGGNKALFLLNAKGKKLHRLTPPVTSKIGPYGPASLSPDGRWVVYVKETYSHGHRLDQTDLYLVRSNGTDLRRLTTDGDSSAPTFSPDGQWIAFIHFFVPFAGDQIGTVSALSMDHPRKVKTLTGMLTQYPDSPAWGPG
jgi:WD40-like Beta Propeller Repeat